MKKTEFIVQDLLSKIYQRQFPSGKLPTQRELAASYGVSRDTVQRAVKTLGDIGVINLVQGSGIYIKGQAHINPLVFNSVTLAPYGSITSKCLSLTASPATESEQRAFDLPGPIPIWHIERLRSIDYVPEQIQVSHMPVIMFPDLSREIVEGSIQRYVEGRGYKISHFMTTYSPKALSKDEAELLMCKRSTPSMHIQTRGILSNGRVFECSDVTAINYSVSYIRPFDREIHRTRMEGAQGTATSEAKN